MSPLSAAIAAFAASGLQGSDEPASRDPVVALQSVSLVNDYAVFFQRTFDEAGGGASDTLSASLDSGLRLGGAGGVTLETRLAYDLFRFAGDSEGEFLRERTRLVHDRPDSALRLIAGDILTEPQNLQGAVDLLGLSLGTAYETLQPLRSIRRAGERLLVLERRSVVEILNDGVVVEERIVPPGRYTVSDFRTEDAFGDVTLNIRDDQGRERVVDFSGLGSAVLLEEGIAEWNLTAGVQAEFGFEGLTYDAGAPVVSGFYRRSVACNLTAGVDFQAVEDLQQAGADLVAPLFGGVVRAGAAVSRLDGEAGYAVTLSQDWDTLLDGRAFANLSGVWYSQRFGVPGFTEPVDLLEADAPDPDFPDRTPRQSARFTALPISWEVDASASVQASGRLSLNAGAVYRQLRRTGFEDEAGQGADWSASLGASWRLTESTGLTAAVNRFSFNGEAETSATVTLRVRFGPARRAALRWRTAEDTLRASYTRSSLRSTDALFYDVAAERSLEGGGRSSLIANGEWAGNRGALAFGGRRALTGREEAGADFAFAEWTGGFVAARDYSGFSRSGFGGASYAAVKDGGGTADLYVRGFPDESGAVAGYSARSDALGAPVAADLFPYADDVIDILAVDPERGCIVQESFAQAPSAYRTVTVIGVEPAPLGAPCLYGDAPE